MEVDTIRDENKIAEIKEILRVNCRDRLLFVMGINTALRIGDLLGLSVGDVVNDKGQIEDIISLKEQKTRKPRDFPLNDAVKEVLNDYLEKRQCCERSEPLFLSQKGGFLSRWQARRILREAGESVGLQNIGTHSLRKTFGYHMYKKSGGDLGLVQKLLNHSTSAITLRYIGIDRDKLYNAYRGLNL